MLDLARSLMFVPGHQDRMVEKAQGLASLDVALLDLEDGVPAAEKGAARRKIGEALGRWERARPLPLVRINGFASEHLIADLTTVVRLGLTGIVVPKVERPDDLITLDGLVAERERAANMSAQSVRFIASIETAAGLLSAAVIARAPRVAGLMFGAEDWANDLGLPTERAADGLDLVYARSAIVVAAAAARIAAFDAVWPRIEDPDGLRRDSVHARAIGFNGKTCIHPSQVEIINEVFTPSDAEVEVARGIVAAFEAAERGGAGAIALGGRMVDRPVIERARRVLRQRELSARGSA